MLDHRPRDSRGAPSKDHPVGDPSGEARRAGPGGNQLALQEHRRTQPPDGLTDRPASVAAAGGSSAGNPIDLGVRAPFEAGFDRTFRSVRIHTDPSAERAAADLSAHAFTVGRDIYFARGTYRPDTGEGRRLLAHELAHVVQPAVDRVAHPSSVVSQPSDEDERAASVMANAALQRMDGPRPSRRPDQEVTPPATTAIQRQVTSQPPAPNSEQTPPLIDRYRTALATSKWTEAAVLLNGFSDADIQARVSDTVELPPSSRVELRLHTPEWAFRVRRPLLIADYNDARAAGRWSDAATLLNGFNDEDIRLLASQLPPAEVGPMVHGAREAMEGISLERVLNGIARRYDEVSPDEPGTKVITVTSLMQAAGLPASAASAYVQAEARDPRRSA